VLLIDDEGEPRIKLYYDDEGKFKGEALILYFKEGSVDLAVTLLDDTELEMGAGFGNMRVKEAEYGGAQSGSAGQPKADKPANGATTGADGQDKEKDKKRKGHSAEEKAKMTKRIRTMQK
jgi:HIV Tat-specific factor 1